MDTIKERNGIDLVETREIRKRWQYIEMHKKYFNDPDKQVGHSPRTRLSAV